MGEFAVPAKAILRFRGQSARLCQLTEQMQLLDASLWPLLEQQFLLRPDGADLRWRGEFWGKLLRGGSLLYRCTGNEALYDTLERSVRRMLKTQDDRGVFSTYEPEHELSGWDVWCRKYVMLGMEYFLEICRDSSLQAEIISALRRHLDAIMERVGAGKLEITRTSHRWLGVNACSILEPVVWLYRLTQTPQYLDFAAYIISTGGVCEGGDLLELALQGVAPHAFPEQKAYETMSFFEGVLEYGRVTNNSRCLAAAEAFARKVLETDVTIIGCCGCKSELFDHSALQQSDPANLSIMQETCVTVTWMRLCRRLFLQTGDTVFLDAMERSAKNALYGTVNTERRTENEGLAFDSYSPLTCSNRGRKIGGKLVLGGSSRIFGCCAANGAFGIAQAVLGAVAATEDGLCLCFYEDGTMQTVTPSGAAIALTMTVEETVEQQVVTIACDGSAEPFTLYLRVPDWAGDARCEGAARRGGWLCLPYNGGTVTLTLTTPVKILRQNGMVALRHGAYVLARDARSGEDITKPIRLTEPVTLLPAEAAFPAKKCFRIPTKDGNITVYHYADCGKTWNSDSMTAAWLPEQ